jgi:hypothetical protein
MRIVSDAGARPLGAPTVDDYKGLLAERAARTNRSDSGARHHNANGAGVLQLAAWPDS